MLNHNGLDVATREELDECHRILEQGKDKWGLKKVARPADQHGTYSFYFADLDDNWRPGRLAHKSSRAGQEQRHTGRPAVAPTICPPWPSCIT